MPWFTTKEVAYKLGVTVRTVERWRKSGAFVPFQRTGGNHSRYTEEQTCAFKQKRDLEQMML
jgi:excisionase family DNA binding protein